MYPVKISLNILSETSICTVLRGTWLPPVLYYVDTTITNVLEALLLTHK